jgi:hypothetical protein
VENLKLSLHYTIRTIRLLALDPCEGIVHEGDAHRNLELVHKLYIREAWVIASHVHNITLALNSFSSDCEMVSDLAIIGMTFTYTTFTNGMELCSKYNLKYSHRVQDFAVSGASDIKIFPEESFL